MTRQTKFTCDPVGVADIARRLGVKRDTVPKWRERHPEFPPSRWKASGMELWDWSDIVPWAEATNRIPVGA